MKVFLSWSGLRSKLLAEALRDWLPYVMQSVKPWISTRDITAGARWGSILANQLNETQVGILCLTRENLNSPWLLFEAGAISKLVDNARVVPLLLDLHPSDISGPLGQFQGVRVDLDGVRSLLTTLNDVKVTDKHAPDFLDNLLSQWWGSLESKLRSIPEEKRQDEVLDKSDRQLLVEVRGWVEHLVMADVRRNREEHGDILNAVDSEGRTPLILATELGDRHEFMEHILSAGADPNRRRADGKTALTIARELGDEEAVRILLEHGATE